MTIILIIIWYDNFIETSFLRKTYGQGFMARCFRFFFSREDIMQTVLHLTGHTKGACKNMTLRWSWHCPIPSYTMGEPQQALWIMQLIWLILIPITYRQGRHLAMGFVRPFYLAFSRSSMFTKQERIWWMLLTV